MRPIASAGNLAGPPDAYQTGLSRHAVPALKTASNRPPAPLCGSREVVVPFRPSGNGDVVRDSMSMAMRRVGTSRTSASDRAYRFDDSAELLLRVESDRSQHRMRLTSGPGPTPVSGSEPEKSTRIVGQARDSIERRKHAAQVIDENRRPVASHHQASFVHNRRRRRAAGSKIARRLAQLARPRPERDLARNESARETVRRPTRLSPGRTSSRGAGRRSSPAAGSSAWATEVKARTSRRSSDCLDARTGAKIWEHAVHRLPHGRHLPPLLDQQPDRRSRRTATCSA